MQLEKKFIFHKNKKTETFYQGESLKNQKKKKNQGERREKPKLTRRKFLKIAGASLATGLIIEGERKLKEIRENIQKASDLTEKRKEEKNNQGQKDLNDSEEYLVKNKNEKQLSRKENIFQKKDKHKKYLEKPQNIKDPKAWCEFFLDKYNEISRNSQVFPPTIFQDNFFIAIQLTESNFRPQEKSNKGAIGLMQIMPSAVADLPEFFSFLKRKKQTNYSGPANFKDKHYLGLIEKIRQISLQKPNYNRAIGKLYLANLFYHYKVGQKSFQKGDLKQTWKLLASAYNQGFSRTKKPEMFWTREAKKYYKKVLNYIQRLENIEEYISQKNLKTDNNYLKMLIAREMEIVQKDKQAKKRKFDKYILLDKYLDFIKQIEQKKGRSLTNQELQATINSFNTLKIVFNKSLTENV